MWVLLDNNIRKKSTNYNVKHYMTEPQIRDVSGVFGDIFRVEYFLIF